MSAEGACRRLALSQYGAIARTQAAALGLTRHQRQRLVRGGEWEETLPGVYVMAGAPDWARRRLKEACLWGGPATAIRRSAAGLWGLDGFAEGPVEIATKKNACALPSGITVYHAAEPPEMVTVVYGIPVTNRLITFMELGAVVSAARVARALDGALMRGQVSIKGLNWVLERYGGCGRWGAAVLRELLVVRTPGYVPPEGDLEPLLWELIKASSLPEPVRQYEIRDPMGRFVARPDFVYVDIKLAIQTDGYLFHARQDLFLKDRHKDNLLQALGWRVLRYTWFDVTCQPDRVIGEIADFL